MGRAEADQATLSETEAETEPRARPDSARPTPLATPTTVDIGMRDQYLLQIPPGARIGRYTVLGRLGEGGMGIVYKAYDPTLDRRIALKLLRVKRTTPRKASRARARLLREAQALAQLSHPNVIAVHDVGTVDSDVFISMELVDGRPLQSWLREEQPSQREIVAAFVAAGRGLAAAHEADIIHRDFKPGNVIVGADNRVRVLDFGVACAAATTSAESLDGTPDSDEPAPLDLESGEMRLAAPLTAAGTVVGTPEYMAPEQHSRGTADERTDQFSFCMALHEALCGERPAITASDDTSQTAREGVEVVLSSGERMPAWLRRIVKRGLSAKPEERYPGMEALLQELASDPTAARKRVAMLVAIVALVGAAMFLLLRVSSPPDRRCKETKHKLAGAWDEGVRLAVEMSFRGSGRTHAAGTHRRVAKLLDDYTDRWRAQYTESCEATARGEQSPELLDLRTACLDRRLAEMRALTSLLAKDSRPEVVDNAVQAVLSLTSLAGCRNSDALRVAVPPPEDPAMRARVESLQARIDHVEALTKAGRFETGLELAQALVNEANAIGYLPAQVGAHAKLATLQHKTKQFKAAEATLMETLRKAGEARDDYMLATVLIRLVTVVGRVPARERETSTLRAMAEAAIARSGDDPELRANLLFNIGQTLDRAGKYDAALEHLERALALTEQVDPRHPGIGSILNNMGVTLGHRGEYEAAQERHERSFELAAELYGHEHPSLASSLTNLGNLTLRQGKYEQALEYQKRALAIRESVFPEEHSEVAQSLNNLAMVFQAQRQYGEARRYYQRALRIFEKTLAAEDPTIGVALNNVGEVTAAQGRWARALSFFERAVALWTKSLGPDHPMMAYGLTGAANCHVNLGTPEKAIDPLQRALAIRDAASDPLADAETRFVLARALWAANRGRKRAANLAREARDRYAAAGDKAREKLSEVERWLEKHRPR